MDGTKMKWDGDNQCRIAAGLVLDVVSANGRHCGGTWMRGMHFEPIRSGPWRKSKDKAKADAEQLAKELVEDAAMAVLNMARALDVDLADFQRMAEQWTGPTNMRTP